MRSFKKELVFLTGVAVVLTLALNMFEFREQRERAASHKLLPALPQSLTNKGIALPSVGSLSRRRVAASFPPRETWTSGRS